MSQAKKLTFKLKNKTCDIEYDRGKTKCTCKKMRPENCNCLSHICIEVDKSLNVKIEYIKYRF